MTLFVRAFLSSTASYTCSFTHSLDQQKNHNSTNDCQQQFSSVGFMHNPRSHSVARHPITVRAYPWPCINGNWTVMIRLMCVTCQLNYWKHLCAFDIRTQICTYTRRERERRVFHWIKCEIRFWVLVQTNSLVANVNPKWNRTSLFEIKSIKNEICFNFGRKNGKKCNFSCVPTAHRLRSLQLCFGWCKSKTICRNSYQPNRMF